jgi:hypothetical protein
MSIRTAKQLLLWTLSSLVLICSISGARLFAQAGTGGISGTVTDSAGAIVPGAVVKVQSSTTGVSVQSTTTGAGVYSFPSLVPASYQVTVTKDGFQTSENTNVVVSVDEIRNLNVTLKPGSVSEVVEVTASTQLVETNNSTVGQLIDSATISRVPLLTRDVYQLIQLSAGVAPTNGIPNASDTSAIINSRQNGDVAGYTVNGAPQGTLQFLVDGSPIGIAENNLGSEIPATQIPLDAIQEYRVETQNTPATYQTGGAGAISLVTKSGTNKFHGDGFAYIRPNVLSANEYFQKQSQFAAGEPNQPLGFHRYQEGGAFGGPILHDKLFIFGDYEATNQEVAANHTYTVPTPAEVSGDFSADNFTIYNPLAPDLPNGKRQPFAGNKIPLSDQNATAQIYSKHFPAPTSAGTGAYHKNNLFLSGLDPITAQKFDIRVDGYKGAKQHIFGRFSFARTLIGSAAFYGPGNAYGPESQDILNARNFLFADDITLSQKTLLQLRYSFVRHYENQTENPLAYGFDMTSVGFPQYLQSQSVLHDIPYMRFGSTTTADLGTSPYGTFHYVAENPYDIIAAVSTTKGQHSLSVGVEAEKQFMNVGQPVAPSGIYYFTNSATSSTTFAGDGYDYAGFLLGMGADPDHEGSYAPNWTHDLFVAEANPYYAAYIQDNYKIRSNLTLSAGVRWDIFVGRTERHNRLEYWDPTAKYSVGGVALTGGEQFVGVNGNSRNPFTTNWGDVGPRASIAWQPTPHVVVRSGAGIYYGPSTHMVANGSENSDGFSSQTTWAATTFNADGNTVILNPLNNPFPNGVVQPLGSSQGLANGLGTQLSTMMHSQRTPATYNFMLGVENDLPHGVLFALAYVGSRGRFLPLGGSDLNQLSIEQISQNGNNLNNNVPNPYANILPASNGFAGSTTIPLALTLEPYPQFNNGGVNAGVLVNGWGLATSQYDSLQTKLQKRLTDHFTTLAAFTWSKLITDDFSGPLSFIGFQSSTGAQDWKDLQYEHSYAPQDIKNQFNWQTSYDLPIGQGRALNLSGWMNQAVGGWTANTIVYLSTGVPIGAPTGTGAQFFNQRVDQTCDPAQGAAHTPTQWFNYNCFATPASQFVAGTSPRALGDVRTNGAHDLDASLYKTFSFGEERTLKVEVTSYNLTNSPQFGLPNVFWNPTPTPANMAGFGQVTSTSNTPRQFQFSARFAF